MSDEMSDDKGAILAKGITGSTFRDSRNGRIKGFLSALIFFIIGISFAILFTLELLIDLDFMTGHDAAKNGLFWTLTLYFATSVCILGLYGFSPGTWNLENAVYEYGLSDDSSPFIKYSEIELIGYGKFKVNGRQQNFITTFSKKRKYQICPTIQEWDFQNDYYQKALAILKEKCAHVPWVEMEWLEWKRKDFSLEEMITRYTPGCPRCGATLNFIPQNQQYYCYTCQQYLQRS